MRFRSGNGGKINGTRDGTMTRSRRQKKSPLGLIPLLAMAALASGCGQQQATPTPIVQVQAVTVTPQSITLRVTGDAVLAPVDQAAISPKITAPVQKFYVMRGSHVRKGQLLAVLDNGDLQAAVLDAKGSYEQAQAAYNTAVKASIPADLQTAKLGVTQAQANLNVAQQVYDSRRSLFQQGAIPGREVDTAKATLVQAQSAYDIAKAHFAAFLSVSHADALKAAAGQLASAKGKYENAEAQLAFSEIRSPIDGVVTERPLYAGETAPAGTPLITVMDVSTLLAKTHLPESQVQLLKVGQPASVMVQETPPRSFTGTVSLVSPALDPGSTTIEVWVKVRNQSGQLKAGMPVQVSIEGRTANDAIVIPKEALLTGPAGGNMVMVIDNGVAHQRKVQAGITDGERVQILSGLSAGERIVTSGAYAMADGTRVKVVPASSDSQTGADQMQADQPGEGG